MTKNDTGVLAWNVPFLRQLKNLWPSLCEGREICRVLGISECTPDKDEGREEIQNKAAYLELRKVGRAADSTERKCAGKGNLESIAQERSSQTLTEISLVTWQLQRGNGDKK